MHNKAIRRLASEERVSEIMLIDIQIQSQSFIVHLYSMQLFVAGCHWKDFHHSSLTSRLPMIFSLLESAKSLLSCML